MTRILVVGGYGAFGARVVERLAREADLELIVAGRSAGEAAAAAARARKGAAARLDHAAIDATRPDAATLASIAPTVIINASGPFQAQDYTLARAAITAGAHYVDLADARSFVTGITVLDTDARQAGVLVTSGASSVPALAVAMIDHYRAEFAALRSIEHAISPGNAFDPGIATTRSILGDLGKAFPVLIDGSWQKRHGWQGLERAEFKGLGRRWLSACDVPDHELLPARYPNATTVRFTAGLEVGLFHLSLWALSGLARAHLIRAPQQLAGIMLWLKRRLAFLGTDAGGMIVRLAGTDDRGEPVARTVHLIARCDHGPYIPALPSVIVARKLARGALFERGAKPCLGMFTLDEFIDEVRDLAITIETTRP